MRINLPKWDELSLKEKREIKDAFRRVWNPPAGT